MNTGKPQDDQSYQVFFYEAFQEEVAQLKRFLPTNIPAGFTRQTIQESGHKIPPADLISIRTQSSIPLTWAGRVTGILSRSTGYDHLQRYADQIKTKLPLGYLPRYCHRSVAEQALLLWMALLRKLPMQRVQFTRFSRDGLTGLEGQHKTLLVVGVGNVGSEIVRIGQALGMNVLGVDIVEKHDFVSYTSVEQGLSQADIIVCAMNLTAQNAGYFHYERFKKVKPEAVFVNIARGELSPPGDLLRLIKEKRLSGVALDVYPEEGKLATYLRVRHQRHDAQVQAVLALSEYPNVILTPHNAFNTQEAVRRKSEQSIQQIEHFLEQGEFLWSLPVP